jgi:drug/metabolite transporter (DMT)-like permease
LNQLLPTVLFGLAASLFWGSGDFSGGLASRRAKATSVIIAGYSVGFVLLVALALLFREPFPRPSDMLWSALAGMAGVIGLVAFYSALASGTMGLVAPISGVLTAALPVLYSALTLSLPTPIQLGGFALAILATIFISLPEREREAHGSLRDIGLALIAGCGFGVFFILISRVSSASTFGSLAVARLTSVGALLALSLIQRRPISPGMAVAPLIVAAGVLDALGNIFFLLSAHSGRLDVAAIVSSLYPAATVLLAALLLRERVRPVQTAGILMALIAIPLISA